MFVPRSGRPRQSACRGRPTRRIVGAPFVLRCSVSLWWSRSLCNLRYLGSANAM